MAYDAQADALSLVFREEEPQTSRELAPGLIVNLGRDGNAVAIEVLDARARMGRDGLSLIEIDLQQL
ncbi:MAG: DUF2283 domain-containing protein [Armatimonadota bacterium]|nr:DUF2283 domain-containing protein [Armatimonadota bacterium]